MLKCVCPASGVTCLEMYRTAPDSGGGSYREMPVHDAASHSADAARMFAEAYEHGMLSSCTRQVGRKLARMN